MSFSNNPYDPNQFTQSSQNMTYSESNFVHYIFEHPILKWIAMGIGVLLLASIIALSYSLGSHDGKNKAIPLIVSDRSPIKVRPQDPGGKQFPYKEISVYQDLRDENQERAYILSEKPEMPSEYSPAEKVAMDTATVIEEVPMVSVISDEADQEKKVQFSTFTEGEPNAEATAPAKEALEEPAALALAEEINVNPPQERNSQLISLIKVKKKEVSKKTFPVVEPLKDSELPQKNILKVDPKKGIKKEVSLPVKKAIPATVKPYLQVGAYRSMTEANKAWGKISHKFKQTLSIQSYKIVKADLRKKGTFYRLRVGPYASKQKALSVCQKLKSKAQGCMYVVQ